MSIDDLRPPGPLAPGGLRVTALGGIGEIAKEALGAAAQARKAP